MSKKIQEEFLLAVFDLQEQDRQLMVAARAEVAAGRVGEWMEESTLDLVAEFDKKVEEILGPDHPAAHAMKMLGVRLVVTALVEKRSSM